MSQETPARDEDDDVRWQLSAIQSCQPRARVDLTAALCVLVCRHYILVEEALLPAFITVLVVHTLDALDDTACPLLLLPPPLACFTIACLPDLPERDPPCCIDRRVSTDINLRARGSPWRIFELQVHPFSKPVSVLVRHEVSTSRCVRLGGASFGELDSGTRKRQTSDMSLLLL